MVRPLATIGARLIPVLLFAAATAGCGGDSGSSVQLPGVPPPPGPAVSGTVLMPNGQVAQLGPSLLERFAALVVQEAMALSGNVKAVGRNNQVSLTLRRGDGVSQHVATTTTNDQGQYRFTLPTGTSEDTCRFLVSVGSGSSLTRAFVYSQGQPINIDYASEAAVRMILDDRVVGQGANLCAYTSGQLGEIVATIRALPGSVSGANAAQINQAAYQIASTDPVVIAMVNAPINQATPTLRPTHTQTATRTNTSPPTSTPTPTLTFTRLPTNTPTRTTAATATSTRAATSTATRTAPPTATRTNTVPPTATRTNTLPPSATATAGPPTATPTATPEVPTATATSAATPQVDIGSADAALGGDATVTIALTSNGGQFVAIAPLVLGFDPNVLGFSGCTSKVDGKSVEASLPTETSVSITLQDATPPGTPAVLPDGPVIDCTFVVATATDETSTTLTFQTVKLTDIDANSVDGTGSSGTITIAVLPTSTVPPTATPPAPTPTSPPAAAPTARLSGAISATDTTIALDDISQFPDSGTVLIGQELVTYSGKQPSSTASVTGTLAAQPGSLLNVQRGVNGTTAQAHAATDVVALVPTGASVNIGSTSGSPGATVTIGANLVSSGAQIAATSNDIVYDSTQVNVALKTNGKPDCTINAAIGTDSAVSKSLVASLPTSPANAKILRVGVIGTDNANIIPDGALFTCNFVIATGATAGTKPLQNVPGASDANALPVQVGGTNGSITVTAAAGPTATPTETPTRFINLNTVSGAPGAVVSIAATLVNSGGIIAATSNDIVFDSTQVDVALKVNGKPDCTINAAIGVDSAVGKSLVASLPSSPASAKILRVGVIGTDNANIIPDGQLFTCNFKVAATAASGVQGLANVPGASDANALSVPVGGSNGAINIGVTASTPTPTVVATVHINLSGASGMPGSIVSIGATLENGGGLIAATSNDIVFDSNVVNVAVKVNGKPDCTINAAIGTDSAASKSLVASLPTSPANAKILRVGVIGTDNANIIPDGPLFTCNFSIAAGAAPGTQPLQNQPGASDANALPVAVSGSNGSITILGGATPTVPPAPTPTTVGSGILINVGSAGSAPGGVVAIMVTLVNGGGQIAATSNDIVYDSGQVNVGLKPNGKPDCNINSAIGVDSAASKSLVASLPTSPANAKILRVGVIGTDNANIIPDGLLFTCTFSIAANATPGRKELHNIPGASDANALPVAVGGSDGGIEVAPTNATPTLPPGPTDTPAAEPTNTVPPQPTNTAPPAATNTPIPEATSTPPVPPTNTVPVPTATQPSTGPAINLGDAAGAAGSGVTIAATLVASGGVIAATSNDIVFDSTQVSVKLKVNGKPDCTINPDIGVDAAASKSLVASLPTSPATAKILRVGVIGTDNANIIPDGVLFTCNFMIAADATAGAKALQNIPGASDASALPVAVGGANGSITVQ